jgi:hypothetical protein
VSLIEKAVLRHPQHAPLRPCALDLLAAAVASAADPAALAGADAALAVLEHCQMEGAGVDVVGKALAVLAQAGRVDTGRCKARAHRAVAVTSACLERLGGDSSVAAKCSEVLAAYLELAWGAALSVPAVRALLNAMESDEGARLQVLRALNVSLADGTTETLTRFSEAGGCEALVRVLFGACGPCVVASACTALARMAVERKHAQRIGAMRGCNAVIQALRRHPADRVVQAEGVYALWMLSLGGAANTSKLVELRATDVVLQALNLLPLEQKVQAAGFLGVALLEAQRQRPRVERFKVECACNVLTTTLMTFANKPAFSAEACLAAGALAETCVETRVRMGVHGVCRLLVDALRRHAGAELVQTRGWAAIAPLARDCTANQAQLSSACDMVLPTLEAYRGRTAVQVRCLEAAAALAKHQDNMHRLNKAGLGAWLVRALEAASEAPSPALCETVVGALLSLASCPMDRAVELGVAATLVGGVQAQGPPEACPGVHERGLMLATRLQAREDNEPSVLRKAFRRLMMKDGLGGWVVTLKQGADKSLAQRAARFESEVLSRSEGAPKHTEKGERRQECVAVLC